MKIGGNQGIFVFQVFSISSTLDLLLLFKAVTKEMFEEALRALADDDFLTVTGKTVRLL